MMTLLQRMESERLDKGERLRQQTRERLRQVLQELLPHERIIVFGSLTRPGRFCRASDIDLALEGEPQGISLYQLISLIAERLERRVDIVLLAESRLADKIRREGETWTLPD